MMGVRLMVEVLDWAPEDASPAERLLLLALAEKADDSSRRVLWARGEDPRTVLRRRVGLSESGLTKALARLAERGHDPRVPVGEDKLGRVVYAFEGRVTEFVVPVLRADPGGEPLPSESLPAEEASSQEGPLQGMRADPRGNPLEPERVPSRGALVPLSLEDPSTRASAPTAADAPPVDNSAAQSPEPEDLLEDSVVSPAVAEAATRLMLLPGVDEATAIEVATRVQAVKSPVVV